MTKQLKRCGVLGLLPPKPDVCQICASDHEPEEPHNQRSLYYQYAFLGEHGRWPTWTSAMEHCSEEVKKLWIQELVKMGVMEDGWEKYQNAERAILDESSKTG